MWSWFILGDCSGAKDQLTSLLLVSLCNSWINSEMVACRTYCFRSSTLKLHGFLSWKKDLNFVCARCGGRMVPWPPQSHVVFQHLFQSSFQISQRFLLPHVSRSTRDEWDLCLCSVWISNGLVTIRVLYFEVYAHSYPTVLSDLWWLTFAWLLTWCNDVVLWQH